MNERESQIADRTFADLQEEAHDRADREWWRRRRGADDWHECEESL